MHASSAVPAASRRETGLRGLPGEKGPRLHDLRHTFAVRSLEACGGDRRAISRHMLALATYLGHAKLSHTWWYLQATPALMQHIAEAGEALLAGGAHDAARPAPVTPSCASICRASAAPRSTPSRPMPSATGCS